MKNIFHFLFSIVVISFLSCASPSVIRSELGENVQPGAYKTFNFIQADNVSDSVLKRLSWSLGMAKLAIADEMEEKGFVHSNTNADLLINVGMVVKEEVTTRNTNFMQDAPRYIGQRTYSWKSKEVEAGRYNVGTITLDIVDNKQNKMIWTGVVEGVVPKKQSKVQKIIRQGVKKLFDKVPLVATSQ